MLVLASCRVLGRIYLNKVHRQHLTAVLVLTPFRLPCLASGAAKAALEQHGMHAGLAAESLIGRTLPTATANM